MNEIGRNGLRAVVCQTPKSSCTAAEVQSSTGGSGKHQLLPGNSGTARTGTLRTGETTDRDTTDQDNTDQDTWTRTPGTRTPWTGDTTDRDTRTGTPRTRTGTQLRVGRLSKLRYQSRSAPACTRAFRPVPCEPRTGSGSGWDRVENHNCLVSCDQQQQRYRRGDSGEAAPPKTPTRMLQFFLPTEILSERILKFSTTAQKGQQAGMQAPPQRTRVKHRA